MITDAFLQFSGASNPLVGQSLALAAGTYNSTNVVDLQSLGQRLSDYGMGESLEIAIQVTQAFAGGTSLQVALVTADDSALSVNMTPIVLSPVMLTAALTLGQQLVLHLDRSALGSLHRYIGLQYVIVGTMTAGAVTASVGKSVQDRNTIYNNGFVVA